MQFFGGLQRILNPFKELEISFWLHMLLFLLIEYTTFLLNTISHQLKLTLNFRLKFSDLIAIRPTPKQIKSLSHRRLS